MSLRDSRHRAAYNDEGDIILPPDGETEPEMLFVEETPAVEDLQIVSFIDDDVWQSDEYQAAEVSAPVFVREHVQHGRDAVRSTIIGIASAASDSVGEGLRQYKVSIKAGAPLLEDARTGLRQFMQNFIATLRQPVWVPSGRQKVRQYSRGTLFVFDVLRFGGTFAVIFAVLFSIMNYQSFLQIASAKLDVFVNHPSLDTEHAETSTMLAALKTSDADGEGRERGDLFSYLPTVGPPDNRIVIPKLKLNVPLVAPPVEALLRQDWVQVEEDIQDALTDGVVHYPGTARPGQAGNFFVTGHSSYYPWAPGHYKTVFARLHELDEGDEYWVYYNGDRHRYIVQNKKEVEPSDTSVLDQPGGMRMATLMTCTPVGTTLRRLILSAVEVDPLSGEPLAVGERTDKEVVPKIQLEALPI